MQKYAPSINGETILSENGEIPLHRHSDARLVVVFSGTLDERDLFGVSPVKQAEFVMRPPYYIHSNSGHQGGAKYLRLRVSGRAWKDAVDHHGWRAIFGQVSVDSQTLENLTNEPFGGDQLLGNIESAKHELSVDPLSSLAAQLRDEHLQCRCAAREMGLKPYQLTRIFFRRYGMTPSTYRREARLQRAMKDLVFGADSLRNIAVDNGYSDQSHMNRELVRATGKSPARFRTELQ